MNRGRSPSQINPVRPANSGQAGTADETAAQTQQAAIIQVALDGIISIDHRGGVLEFNPAAERMFGYQRSEVLGREMASLIIPPEMREPHRRGLEHYLATGEGPVLGKRLELNAMRSDGTEFPVELAIVRIRGEDPPIFTGYIRDITDYKRIEAQLRASEGRFRGIFEHAWSGIALLDREGSFTEVNERLSRMLGRAADELRQRSWTEFAHASDLRRMGGGIQALLEQQGEALTEECRFIRPDGSEVWTRLSASGVSAQPGSDEAVILVIHDISDRVLAQIEVNRLNAELEHRVHERTLALQAAVQEIEAFSYSVSHDLRAPLRSIDGFSQALLEDYNELLDERGQDYLHRVCAAARNMGRLIDDLLGLSRITRTELRVEEIQLSALARTVADGIREGEPGRQVEFIISPGLIAKGDVRLLRIALENLLQNAWKFTRMVPKARIEFGKVSLQDSGETYFVRDNGAGFDMAYADRLFAPFQRLHSASEFPGNGIGLATVQRAMHRQGGRVWAEATVGQGATFYFTLDGELEHADAK